MVNLRKLPKTESFLLIVYLLTIYNNTLRFIPLKQEENTVVFFLLESMFGDLHPRAGQTKKRLSPRKEIASFCCFITYLFLPCLSCLFSRDC